MKRKITLSAILVMVILLACNCKTFTLLFNSPTITVSPVLPPANLKTVTPALPPSDLLNRAPFNISWDDRSLFQRRLTSSYQDVLSRLSGASIYHLAFSLSNPPTYVNGVEEVRYINQETGPLTEVDFAIFSEILGGNIKVSNVLMDGKPVAPIFRAGFMRVPLATALEPGRSVIFHTEFAITVPALGGDFYYGIYGYNNGILSLAHAYPTILVYNEQGWNNQTPNLEGDPLFSDISFYLVSVDAPIDLTLVASGVDTDHRKTAHRQQVLYADGPARDFYLAAGTSFVKKTTKVGETTYNTFSPGGVDQPTQTALKTAEAAIADFSQRYGPYPYTEFNIVPIVTSAGGVEFPGMTAVAQNVYNQNSRLEAVVVHEVAHQWFYNLVGNETQQQPWLDESLAQFVTCQYFLDMYGAQAEQSCLDSMKGIWDNINDQIIPIGEAVSAYTNNAYSAIIYGRGPLFFQALRQQIGQATFDSLMKDYITTFCWDIVTTDSFKKLAEKHCNCDLTSMFNEWIYP
jgi:hypothetical protein